MTQTPHQEQHEFTREVPESDTLLALALLRPIKVFQIESIDHGTPMCIAHFEHDGWLHLYQDGACALTKHLFFWITACKVDDMQAEEFALSYFDGQFVLS